MKNLFLRKQLNRLKIPPSATVCQRSLDPSYIVTYDDKWVKTSWAYNMHTVCLDEFDL